MSEAAARRREAERRGRRAEAFAALAYRLRGFEILERRFRAKGGEIDIVARRGRLVAIVEVKARARADAALEAVGPEARRRIERAADAYLSRKPELASLDLRYDIAAVSGWSVSIIADAWRRGD